MKNIKVGESLNQKLSNIIIVCKEKEKDGKRGTQVTVKMQQHSKPLYVEEIVAFKERNIINLDINEMLELSQTNPKLYCEKLILAQFGDSPILEEKKGTNCILPTRFQRFYENAVSFENHDFSVYFTDLSIKYFDDFIKKLSFKRKEDSLNYALEMINKGKVRNLKINLFDGFDFKKYNYCYYDTNEDRFNLDPKNVLYYTICNDEDGNLDKQDLENIKKILDEFSKYHSGLNRASWNCDEIVAYGKKGGSLLIESHKKDPELLEQVCKLVKIKKEEI